MLIPLEYQKEFRLSAIIIAFDGYNFIQHLKWRTKLAEMNKPTKMRNTKYSAIMMATILASSARCSLK